MFSPINRISFRFKVYRVDNEMLARLNCRNFTARPCHAWNDFSITFVFYYIILRNSLIKYCFIIDRVKNIIAFLNKRPTDHNIIIYWCLFYQRTLTLFHSKKAAKNFSAYLQWLCWMMVHILITFALCL